VVENILYGKGLASNQEVLEASEKANVMEFIDRFKDENDLSNIDLSYALLREELQIMEEEITSLYGESKYSAML